MMSKLGFGFLRLPKMGEELDWDTIDRMVDVFMAAGGTFFDTCYTYLHGLSEYGIRRCVVERKPRDSFQLSEKLPGYRFKSYADCQKYFDEELARCGVEWFDVLMLHWLDVEHYAIAEKYDEFRFLREKKAEGLAKRIGFSYHGDAELLNQILTAHPEVDVVLIQLNYLDWDSEAYQSRMCYETCLRHGKSVMVMEPVKGGTLARIPEEAEAKLRAVHPDWTPADWALRFVRSLPNVEIVLSGMGAVEQVEANMRPCDPLTEREIALLAEVAEIIRGKTAIGCTGCAYCVPHCPRKIPIPQYIKLYNELCRTPKDDWKMVPTYHQMAISNGKASDCIRCRACENHCPQKLQISDHMKSIAARFEQGECV